MHDIKIPKKLIEVALPLDAINKAAAREKSIRLGHPSTLHLWWARRPLAAARAVIFAQMVNDPGYERHLGRGMNKEKATAERERLFKIIEDLVQWENTNNEEVLARAREEIWKSWRETCALNKNHPQAAELFNPKKLPAFHDPFAGGGAIPLEAQRLGLETYASDLNPVAVTINKAMIEIPPRFSGRSPVGPSAPNDRQRKLAEDWAGARALAEDVRRYGAWMRVEAERRIGHLYPKIEVSAQMAESRPDLKAYVGEKLTVIAWLWARTIKSPSPAFGDVYVPLASSFVLSKKVGKEAYVRPEVHGNSYRFTVRVGSPPKEAENGTKATNRGATFKCLLSGAPISGDYIKAEGQAGRMSMRLMAIAAEGRRCRVYLAPDELHESVAGQASPPWMPPGEVPSRLTGGTCVPYGLDSWAKLFTARQLVALTTFSDLVAEAIERARNDASAAGMPDDDAKLENGGDGARAYSEAIGIYLGLGVSRQANYMATLCVWSSHPKDELTKQVFLRQALPMTWDFAETNPFSSSGGTLDVNLSYVARAIEALPAVGLGRATQEDAVGAKCGLRVVSTDPPYYDNVSYSDLSDFFYVWLRRSLRPVLPSLYNTLTTPKSEELVAAHYRHGGRERAEDFFLRGMTRAIENLASHSHPGFPLTLYYAFKQADTEEISGTSNTGWDTFLEAVIRAGFCITGTWPMRTELIGNLKKTTNALASSIILVCRKRSAYASTISRREFIRELNTVLPDALVDMTRGGVNSPVAPVDLSQAIIGPGMAIFSKYAAVLEADGNSMSVRTALQLINRFLAEEDFDHDTQFCLHWFESHGWSTGKFGEADVLARAKGTSVDGLRQAGVVHSAKGELRLLRSAEMPRDWSPERDERTPIWEALHQMIRALNLDGESAAGALLARMPARAEPIRALAYRLYTLCERKGWAEEARAYNELVTSWSSIEQTAGETGLLGWQAELEI